MFELLGFGQILVSFRVFYTIRLFDDDGYRLTKTRSRPVYDEFLIVFYSDVRGRVGRCLIERSLRLSFCVCLLFSVLLDFRDKFRLTELSWALKLTTLFVQ